MSTRQNVILFMLFLVFLLGLTGQTLAIDMTARSLGMGGAFTGVADDLSTLLYNPAGLSQSKWGGLRLDAAFMTDGFDKLKDALEAYGNVGADGFNEQALIDAIPANLGLEGQVFGAVNIKSLGLGFNNRTTTDFGRENSTSAQVSAKNISEGIVGFSYQLLAPPLEIASLALGANLKLLRAKTIDYAIDSSKGHLVEKTASGSGFDLDLGVLAKVTPLVNVGVQLKNVLSSEYDLAGSTVVKTHDGSQWNVETNTDFSTKIKNERVMRVGAAVFVPVLNLTVAADLDNFPLLTEGEREQVLHLGVEKDILFNGLSLRAGTFNQGKDSRYYTVGLGLNITKLHLDLALGSDDGFDGNINGALAARIKF